MLFSKSATKLKVNFRDAETERVVTLQHAIKLALEDTRGMLEEAAAEVSYSLAKHREDYPWLSYILQDKLVIKPGTVSYTHLTLPTKRIV